MTPLESLAASGTKVWLDSVDPDLVVSNRKLGATGATSNPIIITDLIKTGRFDDNIRQFAKDGLDDEAIAWKLTDYLVRGAQKVFEEVSKETHCDNGWVSFELDPLLEDPACPLSLSEKSAEYVRLGKHWSAGHINRMIKVPATPAGLGALEELAAAGVNLNVTLIFSERQLIAAREACWKGMQRYGLGKPQKTMYSIFVSRLDAYTLAQIPDLSAAAQGQVGIVNAKRLWEINRDFWADKGTMLKQEIIFASTGKKVKSDLDEKYVAALAGSDIQTNPPGTNDAVQKKDGLTFTRQVDVMPSAAVLSEFHAKVDMKLLEETLMSEGLEKFAVPQHNLIKLISEKRAAVV